MSIGHINWHPTRKELRLFGTAGLVAAILLASLLRVFHHLDWTWVVIIVATGLVIFLSSWFTPRIGRRIYLALTLASTPIGWTLSTLVLTLVYFLLFTPVALVFKLLRRDVLHRRLDQHADTYWIQYQRHDNPDSYYHQF